MMKYRWDAQKQANERNRMIKFGTLNRIDSNKDDDPRLRYQHDRDRIVWSPAFRRLAHKTQILPHKFGDHYRCRLTHSLEVMQLSSSIARTVGMNDLLCEAIAIGHDLGHTPFGHAGEDALHDAFRKIVLRPSVKGLNFFSHYEQGVDVVTYLDDRDPINGKGKGLDLTDEVREGILKHTGDYYKAANMNKPKRLNTILKYTKHKDLKEKSKFGTMESQLVRICDKISYMISDIEDGIRVGAIHWKELEQYKNTLKDMHTIKGEPTLAALVSTRSAILRRITDALIKKIGDKKKSNDRPNKLIVEPEDHIKNEMNEIWEEVQKPFLNNNIHVKISNERATQIVSCLLCQYLRHPELIPWSFRYRYRHEERKKTLEKLYGQNVEEEIEVDMAAKWRELLRVKHNIICDFLGQMKKKHKVRLGDIIAIKDYIAGMTNNFAESCFNNQVDCPGSHQTWEIKRFQE